jgi:hypothetical protein
MRQAEKLENGPVYKMHKKKIFWQMVFRSVEKSGKKLSTKRKPKMQQNRVIHKVIHVIHTKKKRFAQSGCSNFRTGVL